jgi:hypothetical protein
MSVMGTVGRWLNSKEYNSVNGAFEFSYKKFKLAMIIKSTSSPEVKI